MENIVKLSNYGFNLVLQKSELSEMPSIDLGLYLIDGAAFIALGSGLKKISAADVDHKKKRTEHGLMERSDFYEFDLDNNFLGAFIGIPVHNSRISNRKSNSLDSFFKISLSDDSILFSRVSESYSFDGAGKVLDLFIQDAVGETYLYNICRDFSIIACGKNIVGYRMTNPLDYCIDEFGAEPDFSGPDDCTYSIFVAIFDMMSGKFWAQHNDEDEEIVLLINDYIDRNINMVRGDARKRTLINLQKSLAEAFL